ncbi:hypothetical protein B0H13DRAFT_2505427 [Mycena leptocephala]|nr:hypothetical protein B0H13DRAFT_2505427 [Mycena leptocephala]
MEEEAASVPPHTTQSYAGVVTVNTATPRSPPNHAVAVALANAHAKGCQIMIDRSPAVDTYGLANLTEMELVQKANLAWDIAVTELGDSTAPANASFVGVRRVRSGAIVLHLNTHVVAEWIRVPRRIAVHVIHETRLVTTERESVTHGKHDQIRPLFIATTMGRRKKSGKSSTNAPSPSTPEATTPSTDPLVALAAQLPALAHRICDVSDASSKSQSASTCDTVQPSSEVATSAAAPTPFRCSSEREEAGEDRGVDRALPDAQAGNPGASSEVATSAAAPTPFRCSSEREEAGEDRGADSGSLVRGTVRGPAQPPTPSDTQEARPQPSTLEYNAVFPDSDTYAQEVDLSELIPQYLAECESYVEPTISRELYALHPRHLFLPRRSARLAAAATRPAITQRVMDLAVPPPTLQRKCKATSPADPILRPPKAKRVTGAGATGPIWFSKDGKLTVPNGDWRRDNPSPVASTSALPPVVPSPSSGIKPRNHPSKTSRGGKRTRKKKGEINKEYVDTYKSVWNRWLRPSISRFAPTDGIKIFYIKRCDSSTGFDPRCFRGTSTRCIQYLLRIFGAPYSQVVTVFTALRHGDQGGLSAATDIHSQKGLSKVQSAGLKGAEDVFAHRNGGIPLGKALTPRHVACILKGVIWSQLNSLNSEKRDLGHRYRKKRLEHAFDDFLAATALWTTQWFNKPKVHVVIHILFHVPCFGPSIICATETFESFNYDLNSKGWIDNDFIKGPTLLANRDNAATLGDVTQLNNETNAAQRRALKASGAGSVKTTLLAGALFNHSNDL